MAKGDTRQRKGANKNGSKNGTEGKSPSGGKKTGKAAEKQEGGGGMGVCGILIVVLVLAAVVIGALVATGNIPLDQIPGLEGGNIAKRSVDSESSSTIHQEEKPNKQEEIKTEPPKKETPKPTKTKKETPKATETKKEAPKPAETKKEAPKPAETKKETPKPTETKKETPKPTETKKEAPKPTETKKETSKPAETKKETPKPEETKKETSKPTETKKETPKPAETKKETPKPAKTKKETPKPTETKKETPKPTETKKETPKPAETKKETPKPTETKKETPKPTETKKETPKPAETKKEAPKPAEKKKEAPKPAETKKEAPKPAETKKTAPKPAETKKEAPKPAETKKEAPKPAETKKEAPKPTETKKETPKPTETKKGTPKPVETKKETPKPSETKKETPKPVETKKETPKPAETKKETPKPAETKKETKREAPTQEAPKPTETKETPKPAETKKETPKQAETKEDTPKQTETKQETKSEPSETRKNLSPEDAEITSDADEVILKQLTDGEILLKKDKAEQALRRFENLLQAYPQSPRVRWGRARALDKLAEQRRSNDILQSCIQAYQEVFAVPDCPKMLKKYAMLKAADRLGFFGKVRRSSNLYMQLTQDFPEDIDIKKKLGVQFLVAGMNNHAMPIFEDVLKLAPNDGFAKVHVGFILKADGMNKEAIPYLREGIDSGEEGTQEGKYFFHLGDALFREGRPEESYKVYEKAADRGFFKSVYQRSLYNVDSLKAKPWWTPEEAKFAAAAKSLEDNWEIIREEGLALLNPKSMEFSPEDEGLSEKGDWKQFTIFQQGRKHEENCKKAPKTCAIVDAIDESATCKRGQVKFSVMHPGTHVWPHCGPTNCRLRSHLGLVVPDGCRIRVANETRSWQEGKLMIFDDSFEHEVWQEAKSVRLVLIVDMWHPGLSNGQKHMLTPI